MSSLKYILYDIINILAIFAIYIYIFTNNINSTLLIIQIKKICNIKTIYNEKN